MPSWDSQHTHPEGQPPSDPPTSWDKAPDAPTAGPAHWKAGESIDLKHWERYIVKGLLGEGGMGRVYLGYDPRLQREVALKFLRDVEARSGDRLLPEAQAQAQVDHPHVAKVYEVGTVQGHPFVAMQVIRGQPLNRLDPPVSMDTLVRLMIQVCEGVQEAHRRGLVHRDLKPSNILVERGAEGRLHPYVLDFGLATGAGTSRPGTAGLPVGTPQYMPPEQALGHTHRLDARSDVYALGATLYATLGGCPPFDGTSLMDVLDRVVHEAPVALRELQPAVPRDLEAIIAKAMAKAPTDRYASAQELARDLARFQHQEPVTALPSTFAYRAARWTARNRTLAAVAGLGLAALATLGVLALARLQRLQRQGLWALHFNAQIRDLEAMERGSAAMPLHDRTYDQAQAHHWLETLEGQAERQGGAALGPGLAAMGRGYLALGDPARAKERLERAHALGYRTPESIQNLGLVLIHLYRAQAAEAAAISDRGLREGRLKELDQVYRIPAAALLREAEATPSRASHTLKAWLALAEERFDEAFAEAQGAAQAQPWEWAPRLLAADILLARGQAQERNGASQQALASYDRAREAYVLGADLGRSEPAFRVGEGRAAAAALDLLRSLGQCPAELVDSALAAADQLRVLDPAAPEGDLLKARIRSMVGAFEIYHGGNPEPHLKAGVEDAGRALALAPDRLEPLVAQCTLCFRLGEYRLAHGQQALELLQRGREAGIRALRKAPQDPFVAREAASVLRLVAEALGPARGMSAVEEGLAILAAPLRQFPALAPLWNTRGVLCWVKGDLQAANSEDPRRAWEEARQCYQRTLLLHPALQNPRTNLGLLMASWAAWDLEHQGLDPRPRIQEALPLLQEVLRTDPTLVLPAWALARCRLTEARYLAGHGGNPRPALREAREAVARPLAKDPGLVRLRATLEEIGKVERAGR